MFLDDKWAKNIKLHINIKTYIPLGCSWNKRDWVFIDSVFVSFSIIFQTNFLLSLFHETISNLYYEFWIKNILLTFKFRSLIFLKLNFSLLCFNNEKFTNFHNKFNPLLFHYDKNSQKPKNSGFSFKMGELEEQYLNANIVILRNWAISHLKY